VRLVAIILSAMLTATTAAQPMEPPALEAAVRSAIESFQPLWSPPKGQLRGWVVGIDPAGADLSRADPPLCDDLSLITAAHLYHLVRRAGGKPVLTRVDRIYPADASRIEPVAQTGSHLCVLIRYCETGASVAVQPGAASAHPDDARLAAALGSALGVESTEPTSADLSLIEALRQTDAGGDTAVSIAQFECPAGTSTIGAALRKRCFDHARGLYDGIRRFCTGSAKRPDVSGSPVADTLSSNSSGRLERLVHSIWPEGRLPDERVEWFGRRFVEESVTNPSLVYFEVAARAEQEVVILGGRTNTPLLVTGLEKALRTVGMEQISNQVRTLPDREHLGEQLFGVCRAPMALTYDQPGRGGRPQTQLLFGEPLFLLDREGDSYLLHAGDGYWGWVQHEAVQPMTSEQFDAYMRLPVGAVLQDIDGNGLVVPCGANVRVMRATDDQRVILLPDNSTLSVPAVAVAMRDSEDQQAAARVLAALDLLYVPYVFGGRSPLGLDCSGLVSHTWARLGETPPRDACQQAPAGQLVATHWHRTNIRAGDQLFFINESGKIYHTGLALDATHVIHSAPPCVQIGSFDPQDPLYDDELDQNFFMVKRP
jgi:hypothetical protein